MARPAYDRPTLTQAVRGDDIAPLRCFGPSRWKWRRNAGAAFRNGGAGARLVRRVWREGVGPARMCLRRSSAAPCSLRSTIFAGFRAAPEGGAAGLVAAPAPAELTNGAGWWGRPASSWRARP